MSTNTIYGYYCESFAAAATGQSLPQVSGTPGPEMESISASVALGVVCAKEGSLLSATDFALELRRHTAKPAPAAAPEKPVTRSVSPRVEALLRALKVSDKDFHCSANTNSLRGARAVSARRAAIEMLEAEGRSAVEIAVEAAICPSTVRDHLRAAG